MLRQVGAVVIPGLDLDLRVADYQILSGPRRCAQNMFGLRWFRPARGRRVQSTTSAGDNTMTLFLGLF